MLLPFAGHLYLFSTHITRNKIIAAIVVLVVVVIGVVVWLIRRQRAATSRT